jgi:hypothetical protein
MQVEKQYQQLKADTTRDVILKAKYIAKVKRMTFSGFLGDLIEHAVRAFETQEATDAGDSDRS